MIPQLIALFAFGFIVGVQFHWLLTKWEGRGGMSDLFNMDESQRDQEMNFLAAKNMGEAFTEALAKDPENPFLQGAAEVYGGAAANDQTEASPQ